MRASPAQRDAERKRRVAREERAAEINSQLVSRGCPVILQMMGAGVALVHLGFPTGPKGSDEFLVLRAYNDVEFDQADLANSSAIRQTAIDIEAAIDLAKPLIEERAVAGFKSKFKELMA